MLKEKLFFVGFMKKILQSIALKPSQIQTLSSMMGFIFAASWIIGTPVLLYKVFSLPYDSLQKEHVRMLFVHVPCAMFSLSLYTLQTVGAIFYIIWPLKHVIKIVISTHVVTMFLVAQTLISGSLWGYPTWGTLWAWDARLTSELILFLMLCLQLMILKAPIRDKNKVYRFYSVVLIIGWIDIPIVHYSVQWWNTLHQGYTLSLTGYSTISPVYLTPLLACMLNQIFWITAVVSYRFKAITIKEGTTRHTSDKKQFSKTFLTSNSI